MIVRCSAVPTRQACSCRRFAATQTTVWQRTTAELAQLGREVERPELSWGSTQRPRHWTTSLLGVFTSRHSGMAASRTSNQSLTIRPHDAAPLHINARNRIQQCKTWAMTFPTGHSPQTYPPRHRLKTELFESSYNWHRTCQTTLLLRDSLSLSRSWPQPWSLLTIMLLWHSFLIIIIIIIIISPLGQFPSPGVTPNILKSVLTRIPDPNRSTAINCVHVNGRSLYIVEWWMEWGNVVHHVKQEGNCPGWECLAGRYVRREYVQIPKTWWVADNLLTAWLSHSYHKNWSGHLLYDMKQSQRSSATVPTTLSLVRHYRLISCHWNTVNIANVH